MVSLGLTVILGVLFTGLQAMEYYEAPLQFLIQCMAQPCF